MNAYVIVFIGPSCALQPTFTVQLERSAAVLVGLRTESTYTLAIVELLDTTLAVVRDEIFGGLWPLHVLWPMCSDGEVPDDRRLLIGDDGSGEDE